MNEYAWDDREVLPLTTAIYDRILPPGAREVLPDWAAEHYDAARWARNVRDYAACRPTWRSVPGGRALHAFMDGDDRPLCKIEAPVWRDHSMRWGVGPRPEHKLCAKLAQAESWRRCGELVERQRREFEQERERHG